MPVFPLSVPSTIQPLAKSLAHSNMGLERESDELHSEHQKFTSSEVARFICRTYDAADVETKQTLSAHRGRLCGCALAPVSGRLFCPFPSLLADGAPADAGRFPG